MFKTAVFSLCSILLAVGVICWVTGLLPGTGPSSKAVPPTRPSTAPVDANAAASEDDLTVYFSPGGGCTDALVRAITDAKKSVYVQAAQFTSAPIAKALVAAHERGLEVRVIVDRRKDDQENTQAPRLVEANVPTFTDGRHHTAHNKVVIIDHHLLFTGSFNFTRESEAENAENLIAIDRKPRIVAAYEANFKEHLGHSVGYEK
jgi:phosphatidylserine/phosphatidylglycerophosphate/cardiolipin synthase-like enzyme